MLLNKEYYFTLVTVLDREKDIFLMFQCLSCLKVRHKWIVVYYSTKWIEPRKLKFCPLPRKTVGWTFHAVVNCIATESLLQV